MAQRLSDRRSDRPVGLAAQGRCARGLVAAGAAFGFLALSGCGSISIDGIDGFTPQSQVWLVQSAGTARTHSLLLSNVGDHCRKLRNAEQDRLDADRRQQERRDAGDPLCESTDLWYDDLADAYGPIEKKGAKLLQVTLDREGVGDSLDSRSAPAEGHYAQFGSNTDGSYAGQLRYWGADYWARSADAYTCLTPEDLDETEWLEFVSEDEGDLREIWNLSGGSVDVTPGGEDSWGVKVDSDIANEASDTIGSLKAEFDAAKCEVEVSDSDF